jgi:ABC-type sugar transport system substrate-binding protein
MESDNPWRLAQTKSLRDEARSASGARRHRRPGDRRQQVSDVEDLIAVA